MAGVDHPTSFKADYDNKLGKNNERIYLLI